MTGQVEGMIDHWPELKGMKAALPILQGQAEEAMTELQRLEQS